MQEKMENYIITGLKSARISDLSIQLVDEARTKINHVPSQVKKFKEKTKIKKILAAEDGMKVKISELFTLKR